ncbi:NADP-dependent oxidoreductase [Sphaerisporangium krabiense]|uniref:NADPH:quinone reductase-like Zn-dependent oxidoreductase n=1 Tax=Sphaerisporangium krabiense TaxID=763782 RepID=A0A7W8YZ80_9ACTN|nr:NADP-dependent oxidoreductase [Sphaerisporangium krabiense]MBB5624511.1 NADPH:quinone reductase-like Zn-dependent oxidoreductase [Sphaerisporangium krabiense]
MKAARVHEYGSPDVIRYEDVPRPVPRPGEVLVRVAAASYNPSDAGFRAGLMASVIRMELPFVPGIDLSGTIVAGDTRRFPVGGRVMGLPGGASAEYVAVPERSLAKAPASIPLTHAAAIPVAALTAWQALFEHAHLAEGRRVLVNGAGGGVGSFAVQLAAREGAHVIATAGPRSAEAVRRHGAHEIIDYTATSLAEALDAPVDVLLNLVPIPPEAARDLVRLVRPGGEIVSITAPFDPPPGAGVTAAHFVTRDDVDQLTAIAALVDDGALRVHVTAAHPLSALAHVHRESEAGRLHGKVVVVP